MLFKKLSLLICFISLLAFDSSAIACLITDARGKQYWYNGLRCSDFIINTAIGEKCIDCCPKDTPGALPAPPANLAPVNYELRPGEGGNVIVWDLASDTKIATLNSSGAAKFQGVQEVISTSFRIEKNEDGKTYIVSADGETKIQLSEEGQKKLKDTKEVYGVEIKTEGN
jgi:hypothetical protein